MHNSQELANFIKTLSKEKGISIRELLSDCGLSKNTLSSMSSGGYYPRVEALCKIADHLDCSVDSLLGRSEDIKNTAPVNDADNLIYMSEYTDENIVLISRKNSKSKKYILTDNQITVVESLLSEFRAELPPLHGTLVAEGGEENKTGRRTRKPTL